MNTKLIECSLFISTLLSGFYAGTGFFGQMGGNPALRKMTDATFAEYWQHIDFYMAARMKIFGPILLLSILVSVVLLLKAYRRPPFWCMLTSLLILVTDIVFTLSTNHPLNQLIQSWDIHHLPLNVQTVKQQVANAFDTRNILMISSFVMVLIAVWFRRTAMPVV